MVLFPEGGFLHKRREVSQRYAEKNNLPQLQHVSLPRVGALKAIFSVLPPHDPPANNNSPEPTEPTDMNQASNEKLSYENAQNGNRATNDLTKSKENSCMLYNVFTM